MTRRSIARFLVLILAGLAVAGTSASPAPPPLATAEASGRLDVTADQPIASVVVTLSANAASRSLVGSRVVAQISSGPAAPGTGGSGAGSSETGAVMTTVEPVDRPGAQGTYGETVRFDGALDEGCPAVQDCVERFRISAILLDPQAKLGSVEWQASARLLDEQKDRPSGAPAGSRLGASAAETSTRPAAELRRAALPIETVHLDVDHPQASRFVDLEQPPGPPGVTDDGTWLAFLLVSDSGTGTTLERANIRLAVPGQLGPLTNGGAGLTPFVPPVCPAATSCTTHLRLDLGVASGSGDGARDLDWSIVALGLGPDGTDPPGPLRVNVTATTDLGPDSARLDASQTGTFDVRRAASGSKVAIVALEARTVPQGAEPLAGFLQIRYEIHATGPVGSRVVNVGIGPDAGDRSVPSVSGQLKEGGSLTLTTALIAADCQGRSRCEYGVPFFAIVPDDGPAISLEWTVAARWFPDGGGPIPAGVDLTNRISVAPSAP